VAATGWGASVAMVGQVGADAFGDELVGTLGAAGVETTGVLRVCAATGVALISVAAMGRMPSWWHPGRTWPGRRPR